MLESIFFLNNSIFNKKMTTFAVVKNKKMNDVQTLFSLR